MTILTAHTRGRIAVPEQLMVQVAAVCYRRRNTVIEFLLVTTTSGKWTFPKGGIDPGMSEHRAAEQEAWEEAGASGSIEPHHFTAYSHNRRGQDVVIRAFLLRVEQTGTPLEPFRRPTWFTAHEAKGTLSRLRDPKYRIEFHRVIDEAVAKITGHLNQRAAQ